jgi:hypothetical protein
MVFLAVDERTWRAWFPIGYQPAFNQVTPVAAVSRSPKHVDLFKIGPEGAVCSSAWEEGPAGSKWTDWFQIHSETVFAQEAPVSALARRPDQLDLFVTGLNGAIWTCSWHADPEQWRPWYPIHFETVFRQDRQVTAISRVPEHIDLFRIGFDGAVWSTWWSEQTGVWDNWDRIHPETRFPDDARVTALARRTDHVDLFTVGLDGAVWSCWWHADVESWRPWYRIHPETVFRFDQEIAAVSRVPEHMDLFTVGNNGAVWSTSWHEGDSQGWRSWFAIHPETRFALDSRVTALARRPDHLDLFVTGLDGSVWSCWWHDDPQGWRPWFPIIPSPAFSQDHPVTALARLPEHIDLYKIGPDGNVWSTWWTPV